jgi:hypothetical protein
MTPGMSHRARLFVAVVTFLGLATAARAARAQCCPGYTAATVCANATLTKSRWCIQNTVPTGQAALPADFCAYGDKVISTLETLFNIPAKSTFEFELDTKTGGAHTGTGCANLGDGVAYDAFTGNAYGATSFWGYLLSMHEAINDWTGMASGGWPTDWWADHQSAFPNVMDFHIMNTVGVANNDQNLIKAAAAQKKRFYPGGDSADPKVVALDNVFQLMPGGDGYAGFSHLFAMVTADGMNWDGLGVPNPDQKRSEYVAAYMSLAAGQSVLKTLQGPGANAGGNICNGTPDGVTGDAPYTCGEANIDAIATAHCAANANGKTAADMQALRGGDYAAVPSGPCGATCPSECGCDAQSHCVAPWLGLKAAADGGTSGPGTAGATGSADAGSVTGSAGAGSTSSGGGGQPGGGTGAGGSSSTGGTDVAGSGASTGGGTGAAGSGASTGGGTGVAGSGASTGGGTGAAGSSSAKGTGATASGTGCSCALATQGDTIGAWLGGCALGIGFAFARRRRSRR